MAQMSMSHIRLLLRRETPFTVHDMIEDIVLANGSATLPFFIFFSFYMFDIIGLQFSAHQSLRMLQGFSVNIVKRIHSPS